MSSLPKPGDRVATDRGGGVLVEYLSTGEWLGGRGGKTYRLVQAIVDLDAGDRRAFSLTRVRHENEKAPPAVGRTPDRNRPAGGDSTGKATG